MATSVSADVCLCPTHLSAHVPSFSFDCFISSLRLLRQAGSVFAWNVFGQGFNCLPKLLKKFSNLELSRVLK